MALTVLSLPDFGLGWSLPAVALVALAAQFVGWGLDKPKGQREPHLWKAVIALVLVTGWSIYPILAPPPAPPAYVVDGNSVQLVRPTSEPGQPLGGFEYAFAPLVGGETVLVDCVVYLQDNSAWAQLWGRDGWVPMDLLHRARGLPADDPEPCT